MACFDPGAGNGHRNEHSYNVDIAKIERRSQRGAHPVANCLIDVVFTVPPRLRPAPEQVEHRATFAVAPAIARLNRISIPEATRT